MAGGQLVEEDTFYGSWRWIDKKIKNLQINFTEGEEPNIFQTHENAG